VTSFSITRSNVRHLYADIFWYGILGGSTLAFLNVYATRLGASALQIGLLTAVPAIVNLWVSLPAGQWLVGRSLVSVSFWTSLYPFFLGIARGPVLYLVASLLGGLVWGAISASLINRLMERVPAEQRPAGMALHNLALNLGILVGSLSGPWLGSALGVQPALLVGAGLRFLAGVLLLFWG